MRILAFSDLHCNREAANNIVLESSKADVVVGAGDFGIRGERSTELFDILSKIAVPFVLVSGNHDKRLELHSYCDARSNMFLLDGNYLEIQGITFFGLGGEIPARSDASWNETMGENAAKEILHDAPTYQVLITHTPPYGYCDLQQDGTHEGSLAISEQIKHRAPLLSLCGHIHHSWGTTEKVGRTVVHNLGPEPCWHIVESSELVSPDHFCREHLSLRTKYQI